MDREIKFRGKSKKTGEWLIGDFISNRHIPYVAPHRVYEKALAEDFEIDPETLGQFTGLYDKNGKEIYEYDILKYTEYYDEYDSRNEKMSEDWIRGVSYNAGKFYGFEGILTTHGEYPVDGSLLDCWIIGNKFDNPELL